MLAILKVFGIGLRSSVQARKRPRFCMTIITPRATHRHIGEREEPYAFVTARRPVADFLAQVGSLAGDMK